MSRVQPNVGQNPYLNSPYANYNANTNNYMSATPGYIPANGINHIENTEKESKGFSFGKFGWSLFKGAVVDTIKGLFTPTGLITTAAAIALVVATGGAALPFLLLLGVITGGAQVVYNGGKAVHTAATEGFTDEFYKNVERAGSGGATLVLSVAGAKGSYGSGGKVAGATVDDAVVSSVTKAAGENGASAFRKDVVNPVNTLISDVRGNITRTTADGTKVNLHQQLFKQKGKPKTAANEATPKTTQSSEPVPIKRQLPAESQTTIETRQARQKLTTEINTLKAKKAALEQSNNADAVNEINAFNEAIKRKEAKLAELGPEPETIPPIEEATPGLMDRAKAAFNAAIDWVKSFFSKDATTAEATAEPKQKLTMKDITDWFNSKKETTTRESVREQATQAGQQISNHRYTITGGIVTSNPFAGGPDRREQYIQAH